MERITRVFFLTFALIFSITFAAGTANAFLGQTTRVSLNTAGDPLIGNGLRAQGISADGHHVVFSSAATNLGYSGQQVYRRACANADCKTGTTDIVSARPDGAAAGGFSPSISKNGRYVAFVSLATDLIADKVDANLVADVFLRDMESTPRSTRLVSTNATGNFVSGGGTLSNNASDAHVISDDGDLVVFASSSSELVSTSNNSMTQIYVKNFADDTVTLVSTHNGEAGNGASSSPVISGNGRYVAFQSMSTNLTTPALNTASSQIYVRDLTLQTTSLESVTWDGLVLTGGANSTPSLSRDGCYLAFESTLQLGPNDRDGTTWDVYLRDRCGATTKQVSHSNTGTFFPTLDSRNPAISADGAFVAFNSTDMGLVLPDGNGTTADVFVYTVDGEALSLVSRNDDGVQGNLPSTGPSLSGDGSLVLFASASTNLVATPPSTSNAQLYLSRLTQVVNNAPVFEAGADERVPEGTPLMRSGSFTDADASTSWTGTANFGAGPFRLAVDAARKTWSLQHAALRPGTYVVELSITDDAGATATDRFTHLVNQAPVFEAGGDENVPAGTDLKRSGTFSDADASSSTIWTGTFDFGAGPLPLVIDPVRKIWSFQHEPLTPGTYLVTLSISDGENIRTDSFTHKVNQAPVFEAGGDENVTEGTYLKRFGTFSDADASSSTTWTGTYDFGTGPLPLVIDPVRKMWSFQHEPLTPGTYLVTLSISDGQNAGTDSFTHIVTNVAPAVLQLGPEEFLYFGATLHRDVRLSDPDQSVPHPAETYRTTVDFGDGTAAVVFNGGGFSFDHIYARTGDFVVTARATDSNGGVGPAATVNVHVFNYSFAWLSGNTFVVGRNLPVKFTVRAPDGSFILDESVRVDVVDDPGNVLIDPYVFGDQPSRSVMASTDSYHVNVDTKNLQPGMYWLRVRFSSPTLIGEFRLGTTGTGSATKQRTLR